MHAEFGEHRFMGFFWGSGARISPSPISIDSIDIRCRSSYHDTILTLSLYLLSRYMLVMVIGLFRAGLNRLMRLQPGVPILWAFKGPMRTSFIWAYARLRFISAVKH